MAAEGTTIGQSVDVKGDLSANEDLTIEGTVEGTVQLDQHTITVGTGGRLTAQLLGKAVIVLGRVTGDIMATEKITLQQGAAVQGDLTAPRVAIAEGASFKGKIDMTQRKAPESQPDSPSPSRPTPGR